MKLKSKILVFLCLYFFTVPVFHNVFVRADSYTFLGTENGDWDNPNNWQEGIIPTVSDSAIIQASVTFASISSVINVAALDVYNSSEISGVNIVVSYDINFYNSSSLNTGIEAGGSVNFHNDSFASYNANTIGDTHFYDSSFTLMSSSNSISATFHDSSENRGILGGDGEFQDQSKNTSTGSVNGTGTFGCQAINEGLVSVLEYMPCTLYYFTNTAEENWDNLNLWFLDSSYTIQALRLPGALDTVYINAHVSSAGGPVSVNTLYVTSGGLINLLNITAYSAYFNNDGIQAGSLYGTNIVFAGSSINTGTLNPSSGFDPVLFIGNSQNQNQVIGNAVFGCNAINAGTVTGTITNSTCVTNVTSSNPNGSYGLGDLLTISVTFDYAVNVVGIPELALSLYGSASPAQYSSGTGTNTLTFTYTIEEGMVASDLDYIDVNALTLNGGTIRRISDNTDVTLTLPTPGSAGSLSANKNILVDSSDPVISNVNANANSSTATVTWDTNESSDSRVYYGTISNNYTASTSSLVSTTTHSLNLTGLEDYTDYYFVVVSKDALNNYSTSTESSFTTTDGTAPSVSITSPVSGEVSGTFSINATATDNQSVDSVKFYINTTKIGSTDTSSPYGVSFDSTTKINGSYTLYAVAEDVAGNIATSTGVVISINNLSTTPEENPTSPSGSSISGSVAKNKVAQELKVNKETNDIKQLNLQIEILKKQIELKQKGRAFVPFPFNLQLHDKNIYVQDLQKFLNAKGFPLAKDGYGAPGFETDYFGLRTFSALTKFQQSVGLPATGFFGPRTRDFAVKLIP